MNKLLLSLLLLVCGVAHAGTDETYILTFPDQLQIWNNSDRSTPSGQQRILQLKRSSITFDVATTLSSTLTVVGAATFTAAPIFTTGFTWISGGADPADAGAARLSNAESICWEASPAGTDVCFTVDTSENLNLTNAQSLTVDNHFTVGVTDPADAGALRLENNANICWESNPPSSSEPCVRSNTSQVMEFTTIATFAGTGSMGWSIVAGANTACTTTCTFACVIGFDSGASNAPVDCASALADNCLCAGAN